MEQKVMSYDEINAKLDKLDLEINGLIKAEKLICSKIVDISAHLDGIQKELKGLKLDDALNVLAGKIDGLKGSTLEDVYIDRLTGKQIYELRKKTGMSWNDMSRTYGIPVSTLQYRNRQYKNKIHSMLEDQVEAQMRKALNEDPDDYE